MFNKIFKRSGKKMRKYSLLNSSLIIALFTLLLLISASNVYAAREFTDMMGRKVVIPDEVNSVVTTYKPATQFVLALDAADKITAASTKTDKQKLFVELAPKVGDLPQVGSKRNGVNLESVLSVDPDLVILFPHSDGLETADKLEEQGTAAVIINPESLELIRETTILLGQILDKEEKAAEVTAAYDKIDSLTQRTAELDQEQKKRIYFANSEFTDTVGAEMMQTALIENAGALNPAASLKAGFMTVSPEQILSLNPDLITVSQYFNGSIEAAASDPKYQAINAVKNDEIYRFPSALEPWDFPSPSSYIAQLWLAVRAYPEYYDDIDYREEVNDFYLSLYGRSFEELGGSFE